MGGLASAGNRGSELLIDGYAYGSLSMTAYALDLTCPGASDGTTAAARLPQHVPPDGSNI